MKVTLRVNTSQMHSYLLIMRALENRGMEPRSSKIGFSVTLNEKTKEEEGVHTYDIPRELHDAKYTAFIDESESGGARSDRFGSSIIVCGENGEALIPFFIPRYPRTLGEHAQFASPRTIHVIECNRSGTHFDMKITQYRPEVSMKHVKVYETVLWSGHELKTLPENLACFIPALNAAIEKSQHVVCEDVHFYKQRETYDLPAIPVSETKTEPVAPVAELPTVEVPKTEENVTPITSPEGSPLRQMVQRVRKIREDAGFSQRAFAELIGIPEWRYTRFEHFQTQLTKEEVESIAKNTGKRYEEILGDGPLTTTAARAVFNNRFERLKKRETAIAAPSTSPIPTEKPTTQSASLPVTTIPCGVLGDLSLEDYTQVVRFLAIQQHERTAILR